MTDYNGQNNGYDQGGYDTQGYDQQGYGQQGYDQQGYDQQGYANGSDGQQYYYEQQSSQYYYDGSQMPVSQFDGGVLGWLGTSIVTALMTILTLGIAMPWAVCYYQRWQTSHTIIDGRRLVFVGKGGNLFGKYILWWLLTIVTFGIYSFWMTVNLLKWTTKNTHFA